MEEINPSPFANRMVTSGNTVYITINRKSKTNLSDGENPGKTEVLYNKKAET